MELRLCNLQMKLQQSLTAHFNKIQHTSRKIHTVTALTFLFGEQNNKLIYWSCYQYRTQIFQRNEHASDILLTFLENVIYSTPHFSMLFKRHWWSVTWWEGLICLGCGDFFDCCRSVDTFFQFESKWNTSVTWHFWKVIELQSVFHYVFSKAAVEAIRFTE